MYLALVAVHKHRMISHIQHNRQCIVEDVLIDRLSQHKEKCSNKGFSSACSRCKDAQSVSGNESKRRTLLNQLTDHEWFLTNGTQTRAKRKNN